MEVHSAAQVADLACNSRILTCKRRAEFIRKPFGGFIACHSDNEIAAYRAGPSKSVDAIFPAPIKNSVMPGFLFNQSSECIGRSNSVKVHVLRA